MLILTKRRDNSEANMSGRTLELFCFLQFLLLISIFESISTQSWVFLHRDCVIFSAVTQKVKEESETFLAETLLKTTAAITHYSGPFVWF